MTDHRFTLSLAVLVAVVGATLVLAQGGYTGNELDADYETNSNRKTLRCRSGSDCPASECSVMGMQRFSEPSCKPLGRLGAPCRPGAEPENKSLAFPEYNLECENVYMLMCPCGEGLVCHEGECQSREAVLRQQIAQKRRSRFSSWTTARFH